MRKLMLLLSCLMLVTTFASVAKAVEVGPCPEMSQAAHTPVFCDGDQDPSDCDKNCPRHLSCHGHYVATPATSEALPSGVVEHRLFAAQAGYNLAGRDLDQAHRPPQA